MTVGNTDGIPTYQCRFESCLVHQILIVGKYSSYSMHRTAEHGRVEREVDCPHCKIRKPFGCVQMKKDANWITKPLAVPHKSRVNEYQRQIKIKLDEVDSAVYNWLS